MTIDPTLTRRIRAAFHCIGLSSIGGAICLQLLVFYDIFQYGYFTGTETHPAILAIEIALTGIALAYFVYIYQRLIRQIR